MATDPVQILRERDAEVAQIRSYADLTEEAKNRRIAEVNERAQAAYAEAREANERERAERLERSKKAVFRVPVPATATATDAEEAQIHAAYRAAYNDVYSSTRTAESPQEAQDELERLLQQAERSGDKLLARAAYHRAIDLRVQSVVDGYLASRPAESGRGSPTPQRTRRLTNPGTSGTSSNARLQSAPCPLLSSRPGSARRPLWWEWDIRKDPRGSGPALLPPVNSRGPGGG